MSDKAAQKQGLKAKFSYANSTRKVESLDKFREVFRQNCKKRIHEERLLLIDQLRCDRDSSYKQIIDTLPEIINQEFKSLANENDIETTSSDEFLKEEEKVLKEEVGKIIEEEVRKIQEKE